MKLYIKIKTLQQIRNSIRNFLLKLISLKIADILNQQNSLLFDENLIYIGNDNQREIQDLIRKEWRLRQILDISIYICPIQVKSDKDMIYHLEFLGWYCVNCYKHSS